MGSDWSAPEVKKWMEEASQQQQEYHLSLADRTWDNFKKEELQHLRSKVAFAMFGFPTNYIEAGDELSGYSEEQKKKTADICNIIVDLSKSHLDSDGILMAIVFVCINMWESRLTLPVFRVLKKPEGSFDDVVYVDSGGRVYQSWYHYLQTNNLPKCMYCYPKDGYYCQTDMETSIGMVEVAYGTSPACNFVNRLKSVMDLGGMLGGTFSAVVLVVSFFTPIGPVLAAASAEIGIASAVYGGARSAEVIVDRDTHDQSISLLDPEARTAWIGLVGSLLGITAGGATKAMVVSARSGHVFNMAGRIAVTAMNWGSLTVNGIGVVNGLAHCVDKAERKELTPLDVYQFTLSVLFFTNGVMNSKTASTIIKQTQTEVLGKYESQLSSAAQKKALGRLVEKTRGGRVMHGNGQAIKGLSRIDNMDEFFTHLVDAGGEMDHEVVFTKDGLIRINSQLEIHPDAFSQMSRPNRAIALEATRKFAASGNKAQFLEDVRKVCLEERIRFDLQREMFVNDTAKAFGVEDLSQVKINGRSLFRDLQPYQKDRIASVLQEAGGNYDPEMISISKQFAESQNCKNATEFCSLVEFVCKFISDNIKPKPNQSRKDFRSNLIKELNNPKSSQFKDLNTVYESLKSEISPINESNLFKFKCNAEATYHFFKHDKFSSGKVDPREYFDIANKLFGDRANETNVKLTQEGGFVKMTYTSPEDGLFGVLVKPYRMSDNSGVFVATMYYDKRLTKPTTGG